MSHNQAKSFSIGLGRALSVTGQPMTATPPLRIQSGSSTATDNVKMGLDVSRARETPKVQRPQKPNFLPGQGHEGTNSPWPIKKHQKGPHDRLSVWRKGIYCCVIRMTLKKNNVFVNLTNLKGQTIIKFTSGLIQKKKNKSKLRSIIKWIIEKLSFFVKNNFDCVKVIIKGHGIKSFSYLKELKRKKLRIIYLESRIPVVHNGCRPPKKRRV